MEIVTVGMIMGVTIDKYPWKMFDVVGREAIFAGGASYNIACAGRKWARMNGLRLKFRKLKAMGGVEQTYIVRLK